MDSGSLLKILLDVLQTFRDLAISFLSGWILVRALAPQKRHNKPKPVQVNSGKSTHKREPMTTKEVETLPLYLL